MDEWTLSPVSALVLVVCFLVSMSSRIEAVVWLSGHAYGWIQQLIV